MAKFALLQFKINNTFEQWETVFYGAQNPARKLGINGIRHEHEAGDPQSVFVLMTIDKSDSRSQFYEENKDLVEPSGHILDSTKVPYYENQCLSIIWMFLITEPYL